MLKTILIALALAVPTTALAGQTPSVTITDPVVDTDQCFDGLFDQAVGYSLRWSIDGQVENLQIGVDQASTDAAIKAWNQFVLESGAGNQALIIADANQYIRVTVVPYVSTPVDMLGEYIFLYKNGCYVAEAFVPAPDLVPDDATPAFQGLREAPDPLKNESSHAPGSGFKNFREVKVHGW